jgi:hypothetical protein
LHLKIPLNFVEDVFAGTSKQDSAGLGVLAALDESEILIRN